VKFKEQWHILYRNINQENRQVWLKKTLSGLPKGARILDAGVVSYAIHDCAATLPTFHKTSASTKARAMPKVFRVIIESCGLEE